MSNIILQRELHANEAARLPDGEMVATLLEGGRVVILGLELVF